MVRRVVAALALALFVIGCGDDPVGLLVGIPPGGLTNRGEIGCYTYGATGLLSSDPTYGTTIANEDAMAGAPVSTPVMWLPGFSARRAGSEVEVLDPRGNVVAITGRRYAIDGGYVGATSDMPQLAVRVFRACDRVLPQP